jgi:cation:H+ antiporter
MLAGLSLTWLVLLFLALAVVVALAGTRLTRVADRLAVATGWGEAVVGAILLGGVTSLSGITTSVTAAASGQAELAFSNAVGGIAAQTVFIAIADMFYRKSNLEHASASLASLMQGVTLIGLLGLVLLAMSAPVLTVRAIHPVSPLLLILYLLANRYIAKASDHPMWKPTQTTQTVDEESSVEEGKDFSIPGLLGQFAALGLVVGVAGYFIAQSGILLAERTGLSQSFVGALGTSVATSLPELIVAITAVRRGAITLAVSNIIGGNTFDLLFLCFADVALRSGSLYHAGTERQLFIIALTILLTAVFLLGLLFRQKDGPARIGWESSLMILLFLAGQVVLYFM